MHADTLTEKSAKTLFTPYNRSEKHAHLQFFAHFVPNGNDSPQRRRRRLMKMHEKYLYMLKKENILAVTEQNIDKVSNSMALFSIEGGGGLFGDSHELYTLFCSGLRVLGFAWDKNELCASSRESGNEDYGLTKEGVKLLSRIEELGIFPDVSHMSDRATDKLLSLSRGRVLATHSNFRAVCNSRRNLTDEFANEIAAHGGLIGINLYPYFLNGTPQADVYDVIRHIDYGLSLVGKDAIALGLDIDGTGGVYPKGFSEKESIHDALFDALTEAYDADTLIKIFGGNVLNFLSRPQKN